MIESGSETGKKSLERIDFFEFESELIKAAKSQRIQSKKQSNRITLILVVLLLSLGVN